MNFISPKVLFCGLDRHMTWVLVTLRCFKTKIVFKSESESMTFLASLKISLRCSPLFSSWRKVLIDDRNVS